MIDKFLANTSKYISFLLAFLQDFVNFKKEMAKESAKRREPTLTKVSLF